MATGSAVRALGLEYKGLQEEPVEGFRVKLVSDEDMFVWEVALFGPPDTLYQGGYFKVSVQITVYRVQKVRLFYTRVQLI
jgi:ubiquitin-conjugating enzyme E2 R